MKAGKIIKKNIKLLLRSRVSTLVLILGPLLVIVLVGLSFSTNTFSLNMGVYSEKYSDLTNSFVEKLQDENYGILRFESEELCIDSVKETTTHACIIFPPDMTIDNENTNVIKFHVDQSKVNLVYLVMSTLTSSFGEKTSEISKDLTTQILTTLSSTGSGLQQSSLILSEITDNNNLIDENTGSAQTKIQNLDLDASGSISIESEVKDIKKDLDELRDDSLELVDDGLELIEDIRDYDVTGNDSVSFDSDLDNAEEILLGINSSVESGHNVTAKQLNKMILDVETSFKDLSNKLEKAKTSNLDVVNKLKTVKEKSSEIKEKTNELDQKINGMITEINSISIIDADKIVSPIQTEINPVVQSESNLGFLFPTLVVMLIMFIGLLLPATLIIMEKNSKAFFRIFTTPTKNSLFILSTYLTSIILITIQLIIILAVSQFYFKVDFSSSFFISSLSLIVIMTFFVLSGMLIGYLINSEEMAMMTSVSIGTLLLLTSGIIFPLESMPPYLSKIAKANPFVLGSEMFKQSLLFSSAFKAVRQPLGLLLLFSAILVSVILLVKKANSLKLVLKKPNKNKIKKDNLVKFFDFGERKAQNLSEFTVSIQNLSHEKFQTLLEENAFSNWLLLVYKNRYLSKKIENIKDKKELLKILVEELKKTSEQKK